MAKNVTFKVIETRDGEWVLYLHNHGQKMIYEKLRCRDLDEVIKKLKGQIKYRQHFNNALFHEIMMGQCFLEGDE